MERKDPAIAERLWILASHNSNKAELEFGFVVAQAGSLPYRGLAIRRAWQNPNAPSIAARGEPFGDTADCQFLCSYQFFLNCSFPMNVLIASSAAPPKVRLKYVGQASRLSPSVSAQQ